MEFGVHLAHEKLPMEQGTERMAVAAERLGFDAVWVSDRIVTPVDFSLDTDHAALARVADRQDADPLISLAYIAGRTRRIRLGPAVLVLPLRNPLLTAKMLATLDVLAGGRVILGAGVGWLPEEFPVLRVPEYPLRGEVTDEWIAILRGCWESDHPSFTGRHYSFPRVHFSPRPARPIPIWVGGNSAPALRRAGRLGDGWLGTRVAPSAVPAAIAGIRAAADAAGRDLARFTFGLGVEVDLVDDLARASRRGLVGPPEHGLVGPVDAVCAAIDRLRRCGIGHLELRFRPAQDQSVDSIEPTLEMMQRFAEEVIPRVRA